MNHTKKISIIGGTGNLGIPVVKFLLRSGFEIKLIVRNTNKAKDLFGADNNIQIIEADLTDVSKLTTALADTEYLYLNLSTNAIRIDVPFSTEREGIANILKALNRDKIKQIIAISGLGAFDNVQRPNSFEFVPNIIRKQGHKLLKDSGIPYTILHCSYFADSFVIFRRNNTYLVIGNTQSPIYFTNCADYTNFLINAIANENAFFKEFPIQGKEGLAHPEAARKFLEIYSKRTKITVLPGVILRLLALFSEEMKFVKHMSDYFSASTEEFIAEEYNTYKILGEPKFNLTSYAQLLKSEQLYLNVEKTNK
jgi:uncharacterized protein YbjT (DUF2867 family)